MPLDSIARSAAVAKTGADAALRPRRRRPGAFADPSHGTRKPRRPLDRPSCPRERIPLPSPQRLALVLLVAILCLALYLRVSRLNSVYWFAGDQGRESLVVRNIFVKGDLPSHGALHSYGGWHYGPAYFYLNAPAYLLMRGDPRFGAVTQSTLGLVGIVLLYLTVRHCGGSRGSALLAALLLATNPAAVVMDRTFWNPHLMPFFCLFGFWYALMLADGRRLPLSILALTFAILTQLHLGGWPITAGIAVGLSLLVGRAFCSRRRSVAPPAPAQERAAIAPRARNSAWRQRLDWALLLLILLVSAALWIHNRSETPGYAASPYHSSEPHSSPFRQWVASIGASAVSVLSFSVDFVFPRDITGEKGAVGLGAITLALLALRLFWAGARAIRAAVLAACILAAFVAAYACLTAPPNAYTFCGLQPILLGMTALAWGGGPTDGRGARAARRPAELSQGSRLGGASSRRSAARLVALLLFLPLLWFAFSGARFLSTQFLKGNEWIGTHFRTTRRIAKWIAKDSGGRPFALVLSEGRGNSRDYIRYLLLREGVDCANGSSPELRLEDMAQTLYLVLRPALGFSADPAPFLARLPSQNCRTKRTGNAWIVRAEFASPSETLAFLQSLRDIAGVCLT